MEVYYVATIKYDAWIRKRCTFGHAKIRWTWTDATYFFKWKNLVGTCISVTSNVRAFDWHNATAQRLDNFNSLAARSDNCLFELFIPYGLIFEFDKISVFFSLAHVVTHRHAIVGLISNKSMVNAERSFESDNFFYLKRKIRISVENGQGMREPKLTSCWPIYSSIVNNNNITGPSASCTLHCADAFLRSVTYMQRSAFEMRCIRVVCV